MDRIETLCAGAMKHAHEIDDRMGLRAGSSKRGRVSDIGLNRHHLAGSSEGLEVAREVRSAAGNTDTITPFGKGADHVTANEARAADDSYERVGKQRRHSCLALISLP